MAEQVHMASPQAAQAAHHAGLVGALGQEARGDAHLPGFPAVFRLRAHIIGRTEKDRTLNSHSNSPLSLSFFLWRL